MPAVQVSRRNLVQDLSRRYVVFIDGIKVGTVAPYRTAVFEVAPGWHRVWARLPGTGDTALGDVVVNVKTGAVRRVRTTSRLKRVPFTELVRAMVATVLGREPRFAVDFHPRVLLCAWPASDDDRDPPPLPRTTGTGAGHLVAKVDPARRALAERIRNATFAAQRRGYSPRQVDKYLEALASAVEADQAVGPAKVAGGTFTRARLGYDTDGVDRFMNDLQEILSHPEQ